jgi:hypothetical protein
MKILTFDEISEIYCRRPTWDGFARAIELAVLEKLKNKHKRLKPMAYVNFETLDTSVGFYENTIPDGYEGVYTETYVASILSETT